MPPHAALQSVRRLLAGLGRRLRRRPPRKPLRTRPEFSRVNSQAGIEPIRPELSGLDVREAQVPGHVDRVAAEPPYHRQPSEQQRRREAEERQMNDRLRHARHEPVLPPVLVYDEETVVALERLQPFLEEETEEGGVLTDREEVRDLRDLETRERQRKPVLIEPFLPAADESYLFGRRPLLPRPFREYLRWSPYPRIGVVAVLTVLAVVVSLYAEETYRAEATAAGQYRQAKSAFTSAFQGALTYGIDRRALRSIGRQAALLDSSAVPGGFVLDRSRLSFFRAQDQRYDTLLASLRLLERRALRYWTWREGVTYAPLVEATHQAAATGLPAPLPNLPGCSTAACFRRAVLVHARRTAWLLGTVRTIAVYTAAIAASPDPAAAASAEVQELANLRAIVPRSDVPVPTAPLAGELMTAGTASSVARVGALAHLDVDAVHLALVQHLPRRAIVVSLEEGTMALYQQGRVVYRSLIAAGPAVPTGIFHIGAKQAVLSTLFSSASGQSTGGSLPDWMPFQQGPAGAAALEGAPWRTSFGPGSNGTAPHAPQTLRSIDLPLNSADLLYSWASVGTEVVVY